MGAGAIGLFVGGRLAASGVPVHFVARPGLCQVLQRDGLEITGLDGRRQQLAPSLFGLGDSLATAPDAELILLTVKGPDTEAAGRALAARYPAGQALLALQSGVDSLPRLEHLAPGFRHHAGLVTIAVAHGAPARVRQSAAGQLAASDSDVTRAWASRFDHAGLPLDLHPDLQAVQWSRLLQDLAQPVNAAAGVPLRDLLLQPGYRKVIAALQSEALALLRRAAIRPARATTGPATLLPTLLRLPTPLFRMFGRSMLASAPGLRSTMLEDRLAGRRVEIDELCGAVVRLAESMGLDAPLNRRMHDLVRSLAEGETLDAERLQRRMEGVV